MWDIFDRQDIAGAGICLKFELQTKQVNFSKYPIRFVWDIR
jgi:hypothetical protein